MCSFVHFLLPTSPFRRLLFSLFSIINSLKTCQEIIIDYDLRPFECWQVHLEYRLAFEMRVIIYQRPLEPLSCTFRRQSMSIMSTNHPQIGYSFRTLITRHSNNHKMKQNQIIIYLLNIEWTGQKHALITMSYRPVCNWFHLPNFWMRISAQPIRALPDTLASSPWCTMCPIRQQLLHPVHMHRKCCPYAHVCSAAVIHSFPMHTICNSPMHESSSTQIGCRIVVVAVVGVVGID